MLSKDQTAHYDVINKPDENAGIVIMNLTRPGTLVKPGFLFVEATWFKQCKLVKPRYLGFQRLLFKTGLHYLNHAARLIQGRDLILPWSKGASRPSSSQSSLTRRWVQFGNQIETCLWRIDPLPHMITDQHWQHISERVHKPEKDRFSEV